MSTQSFLVVVKTKSVQSVAIIIQIIDLGLGAKMIAFSKYVMIYDHNK